VILMMRLRMDKKNDVSIAGKMREERKVEQDGEKT